MKMLRLKSKTIAGCWCKKTPTDGFVIAIGSLEESGVICYCVLFRSHASVCWDARTKLRGEWSNLLLCVV